LASSPRFRKLFLMVTTSKQQHTSKASQINKIKHSLQALTHELLIMSDVKSQRRKWVGGFYLDLDGKRISESPAHLFCIHGPTPKRPEQVSHLVALFGNGLPGIVLLRLWSSKWKCVVHVYCCHIFRGSPSLKLTLKVACMEVPLARI
jgi:hypothetical protein